MKSCARLLDCFALVVPIKKNGRVYTLAEACKLNYQDFGKLMIITQATNYM
jgi:hypothetical protein